MISSEANVLIPDTDQSAWYKTKAKDPKSKKNFTYNLYSSKFIHAYLPQNDKMNSSMHDCICMLYL